MYTFNVSIDHLYSERPLVKNIRRRSLFDDQHVDFAEDAKVKEEIDGTDAVEDYRIEEEKVVEEVCDGQMKETWSLGIEDDWQNSCLVQEIGQIEMDGWSNQMIAQSDTYTVELIAEQEEIASCVQSVVVEGMEAVNFSMLMQEDPEQPGIYSISIPSL